jgi:PPK2 family polyphosphate:nucleotide phosphotransferase
VVTGRGAAPDTGLDSFTDLDLRLADGLTIGHERWRVKPFLHYTLVMMTDRYRVEPGTTVHLDRWTPDDDGGLSKAEGLIRLEAQRQELERLQELLYADGRHKVLVVLQAIDAGGKDGTIRAVFDGVNPQGVRVASFKRPTDEERAHDFLWRVHQHTPGNGILTIFNRSHYEDVLVVRVHGLVPEARWKKRYGHIRAFEQLLVDEGTTVLKFLLHISKDEQRQRQQERIDDPAKRWKFSRADLDERAHWDAYMAAFEDMLTKTSTEDAPWYVVPADRNWYRNLVVTTVIVDALKGLELRYPAPEEGIEGLVVP